MAQYALDGAALKQMFIMGARMLEKNKSAIDALNVFPVPDGDTGTNMSLTMASAMREVLKCEATSVAEVADVIAKGALKGARGNSGVILSQIFKGLAKGLAGLDTATAQEFARSLSTGSEMAYKAVMKPQEGTILTVAKELAASANEAAAKGADLQEVFDALLKKGEITLAKTPELLPVLKQAGVVDAGGKGLLVVYNGFKAYLKGEKIDLDSEQETQPLVQDSATFANLGEIKFGYCTEFIIKSYKGDVTENKIASFRNKLERIGDSVLVVGDGDIVKVHVHTNDPGKALQWGMALGELTNLKIENMWEQHRQLVEQESARINGTPAEKKAMGVAAVAVGEGLVNVFKDLTADYIIRGGQTMNPSVEDIGKAIEKIPSDRVFILPNNSNIVLTAYHAGELTKKTICVIPTKTVPQGIAAMLAYNPELSFEENEKNMCEAVQRVKTGQVTYAVRDSFLDEKQIKKGYILGLNENKIEVVGQDVNVVLMQLIENIVTDDHFMITVFYGQDVPERQAKDVAEQLAKRFPHCDIEMHSGGQPLYHYLFSVE